MIDPGLSDRVDQGPSCRVPHDIGNAALGAVHIGLADIAEDNQLPVLHNLAELVLGIAVDVDLHPVDTGRQVVAGSPVDIDPTPRWPDRTRSR